MVRRPSCATANMPVSSANHRQIVHTASRLPLAVPVGGSIDSTYLNDPSMDVHPCVNVRKVGMTCAMVVSFSRRTGPMTSCASAMNRACHHSRNASTVPASATRQPMAVAGTAATAHAAGEPYTSMRLLAMASVSSAVVRRLANCRLAGRCALISGRCLPLRVIQTTECVESAHDPVKVWLWSGIGGKVMTVLP